jgi:hypothetical protein
MTIDLTPAQQQVLAETAAVETTDEFGQLRAAAETEMNRVVREVLAPNQAIDTTRIELRDLYLSVDMYSDKLAARKYGPERRALFRDAIRLLETAFLWFGEGQRTGVYRPRTVEEVVQASRPWRARIAAIADHAFVFQPEIAALFADVNTSGTIAEEKSDLATMNALVTQHAKRLSDFGLTNDLIAQGKALLDATDQREMAGIVGVRNSDDAMLLRNRLLTYAVTLAAEARVAGINACFDDEVARARFARASFQNALRRLRGGRRAKELEPSAPLPAAPSPDGD